MPFKDRNKKLQYDRAYHKKYTKQKHIYVGRISCIRCAEIGRLYESYDYNIKTKRIINHGWNVKHKSRTHYLSNNYKIKLSELIRND